MKASSLKLLPLPLVAAGLIVVFGFFLVRTARADNCPSSQEYCDTLNFVYLDGISTTASYTTSWEGSGESTSSSFIDTISVSTTGWEYCDGNWYSRWSDYDSHNSSNRADTYGASAKLPYCNTHYCETDSSHYFYESGSFTANPNTYDQEWCS